MRWIVCLGVWLSTGAIAFTATIDSRIGPVIARLSQNHGVHAGDVVIWAAALMASASVTTYAWITRPSAPPPLQPPEAAGVGDQSTGGSGLSLR